MTISAVPKSASSLIAIESLKNEHNTASNLGYGHTLPKSFCAGTKNILDRASLFTHKNGDVGTISVKERRDTVPISDRIGVHTTPDNFSRQHEKFRLYRVNISELTSFAKTSKS